MTHGLAHHRLASTSRGVGGGMPDALASVARLPLPVLIYVLCVVFPVSIQVGPLVVTSLRLFLMIMFIPLAVQLLMGRSGRIIATDILFFLFIAWSAIALSMNNPSQLIEQTGSVGIEFLGGYLLARAYVRTPEAFLGLCRLLVGIVFFIFPFAVVEALTSRSLLLEILGAIPGLGTAHVGPPDSRLGLDRVQATFAHPIHFGLFCSIVLSLCVVGLKGSMSTGRRLSSAVVILAAGFLGLSSAVLSALALQIGLILWSVILGRFWWRWWLLVALICVAYVVVDVLSNRTPIRVFLHYLTFSAHTGYWRLLIFEFGMDNVWANPIFGIGLDDWVRPSWMHTSSVDNFWLLNAMRYGIPAFFFLALGYLLVLGRVMRRDLEGDPVLLQLRRAWVFTFLGLSFVLFTVHVWGNVFSFVFFIFGAGVWFMHATPRQETSVSELSVSDRLDQRRQAPSIPQRRAVLHPPPGSGRQSPFTRF